MDVEGTSKVDAAHPLNGEGAAAVAVPPPEAPEERKSEEVEHPDAGGIGRGGGGGRGRAVVSWSDDVDPDGAMSSSSSKAAASASCTRPTLQLDDESQSEGHTGATSSSVPSVLSPLGRGKGTTAGNKFKPPDGTDVTVDSPPSGGHRRSSSSASHALSAHLSHIVQHSSASHPLAGAGLWTVRSAPGTPPTVTSPRGVLEKSPTFQLRLADASTPEFWQNLPNITKYYFCLSLLIVPMVLSLVMLDLVQHQLACTCGTSVKVPQSTFDQCPPALRGPCTWQPQSTYVGLIVSTTLAHHVGFLFGGILFENSHSLIANILLTFALLATVIYFTISEGSHYLYAKNKDGGIAGLILGCITASLQLILVGMAPPTYKQMGWRTYSRCAADVRVKNPEKMWRLYTRINVFTTILKLDFMLVLLVMMVSLTVWIDFQIFEVEKSWLVICFFFFPLAGFLVNLLWLVACWVAVRTERVDLAKWTAAATPLTAIWTIMALVTVIVSFDSMIGDLTDMGVSDANVKAISRDGVINLWWLSVLAALQVVARLLCGYRMWLILSTYSLPLKPTTSNDNNNNNAPPQLVQLMSMAAPQQQQQQQMPQPQPAIHPHLLPLTRGAWIGKPSATNPHKKRFFQLSSDGTTLRWSWDKYVLMLYVDSVEEDDEELELTLSISAEPDLVLRFLDDASFRVWSQGLRKVMRGLLMPEGIDDDSRWSAVDLLWHLRGTGTGNTPVSGEGNNAGSAADNELKGHSQKELRLALEEVQGVAGRGSLGGSGRLVHAFRKIGKTTRRRSVEDPAAMRVDLAKRRAVKNRASREAPRGSEHAGSGSLASASPRACVCLDPSGPCGCCSACCPPNDNEKGRDGGAEEPSAPPSHLPSIQESIPIQESSAMRTASLGNELGSLDDAKAAMPRLVQFHSMQLESSAEVKQLYPAAQGGFGSGSSTLDTSIGSDSNEENATTAATPEKSGSEGFHSRATMAASTHMPCVPVSISSLDQTAPIAEQLGLAGRVDDVEIEDLQLGKFLGAGAEGVVFAAWYNETPVAVKKTTNVHEVQMQVLAGSHDNIVSARGVMVADGELLLVMEYCPRGTLDTMIHHASMGGRKPASSWDPVKVVLPMVRNIARGLLHLHKRSMPILHRDLKPGNIFVGHGLVMKIGDYGMSRQVTNASESSGAASGGSGHPCKAAFRRTFTTGVVGTSVYSAPEVIAADMDDEEVDSDTMLKADVYSFGVTLWEILSRKRPFDGLDHFQIHSAWLCSPQDMVLPPVKIDPALVPQAARVMATLSQLAADCTKQFPRQRPAAAQIVARLKTALNGTDTAV